MHVLPPHPRVSAIDSGKPMVDAAFGEVMVTCEKIWWLLREGERWLRPERRSPGIMVGWGGVGVVRPVGEPTPAPHLAQLFS